MSAVSPVFEVGGGGRNATPWLYDAKTVDRFRDAVLLHYALFPYLHGLAENAARTGEPITRPLAFDHPDDEEAWAADQEMLIGPDLLAAPVTADRAEADGAAERPTPVDVYLPEGSWIDLYTGEVVEGGRHVVRESTLDDFPLYLRVGGAIGFNLRADDVWDEPWGLNDLDRTDRSGWLLAPGEGVTRAANGYGGEVEAIRRGDRLAIELDDAPEETQVLLAGVEAVRDVRVDGRSVSGGPGADLRGERTGWTTRSGPFGGVLLKLQPRGGDSMVTLTLG
jgi:alpha-D-xyloside xylohydrolase